MPTTLNIDYYVLHKQVINVFHLVIRQTDMWSPSNKPERQVAPPL